MNLVQLTAAAADAPAFHVVRGKWLLVVSGSRLYALDDTQTFDADEARSLEGGIPVAETMPDPVALSLNIAQSCNLACRYCYADEGRFGGDAKLMPLETAIEAIRRHVHTRHRGPVSVGFIGGEPLLNREVLHAATQYAASEAARAGIAVTFGITTNGTLIRESDIELFRTHGFAVTLSMDGARESHDALRPARNGAGSFDRAVTGIAPLLERPGRASVSARVTVTRRNMDVGGCIEALGDAGFNEIGVSPMRTGPEAELRIAGGDWSLLQERMQDAAERDWERARKTGGKLRFSNFSTSLRQLYRGASNALPCGAAASYVSLSAEGKYYTCHRTVGDANFAMGDLQDGLSVARRRVFVEARTVDRQEPCRSCWARYLCGGGCHAEVMRAGREGCDAIRGWLEFCISIYPEVLATRPDLLKSGSSQESRNEPKNHPAESARRARPRDRG